jgi:uncharacterized protein YdaU (DUF1376 family)
MKIRHIDFYPDEFLTGTASMSNEVVGAYWRICALIYSNGGPIEDNETDIAHRLKTTARCWKRIRHELVELRGKLTVADGMIHNGRSATELDRSAHRVTQARENGKRGGRPRSTQNGEGSPNRPPMHPGSVARPSGDRPPMDGGNFQATAAENNGLGKPDGFSGKKLTNQLGNLPTGREPAAASQYAFDGRVIQLNAKDLTLWRQSFPNVDLLPYLASRDAWLAAKGSERDRRDWFRTTAKALEKQQAVEAQRAAANPRPAPRSNVKPGQDPLTGRTAYQQKLAEWMEGGCVGPKPIEGEAA